MINLHHFEETFEGIWWSPAEPDQRRHGRLECAPWKTPTLHVTSVGEGIPFPDSPAILCGQSDGKKMTLWNCFQNWSRVGGNEFKVRYSVQAVILGVAAADKDHLCFDAAEFSLEHLSDWIGRRSITETRLLQDKTLQIDPQRDVDFQIADGLEGALRQNFEVRHPDFYTVEVAQRDSICLRFAEPRHLAEITKEINSWKWLISLLMGRAVGGTSLAVKNQTSPYGEPKDVIYNAGTSRSHIKRLLGFDMLCSYDTIHEQFEKLVQEWQRIRVEFPAVLHRYFSTVFKHRLYTNEEFLFLAQAIESYWKTKKGGRCHFRECVKEAFDSMPFFVRKFIGDREVFADAVVNNRNFYTHYDPEIERKGKVLEFNELYELRQKMQFVVEALLLQELGLPESVVGQVIDGQRVRQLIEYQ